AYDAHLAHVVATVTPRMILTCDELAPGLSAVAGPALPVVTVEDLSAGSFGATPPAAERADLALLQFTAGSSGRVRAVRVSYDALERNVAAIRTWLRWTHRDTSAFWVPHYHDMGLIGGLIAPLTSRCDVWLLTPEQFVRRPVEYLRCFGERGANLTALPAFGLDYVTRRVKPEQLDGMDFSGVRGFIVGAEPIDPAVLTRFADLLAPFGLRPGTLLPAYGLAEATLAVTGLSPGDAWTARAPASGGSAVVGCGRPLGDARVDVVDEAGQPVEPGCTGEIVVSGGSLASGYEGAEIPGSLTAFEPPLLRSGDAGFFRDGQLFPIGRLGDGIKIRGRMLFAETLERELCDLGYSRRDGTVVLGVRAGRPVVVWIAERLQAGGPGEGLAVLARLAEHADVVLVETGHGAIARTSSGKPRRRLLWDAFLNDRISGRVSLYSSRGVTTV
ncbi:MAG: AMP-binding protein, partial [Candidatus Eremiobacteraeota bacterium]|nr:AMP-binding protein [Candidatus Eremiobacteraeota bacterium]